MTYFGLTIVSA